VSLDPFYVVQRLKPYTNYTFYVRAYTSSWASGASESVVCETDEFRPAIAPILTMLQAISPTSVKVGWNMLQPAEARGKLTSHKVQYRVSNTLTAWVDVVAADVFNYTIRGEKLRKQPLYGLGKGFFKIIGSRHVLKTAFSIGRRDKI